MPGALSSWTLEGKRKRRGRVGQPIEEKGGGKKKKTNWSMRKPISGRARPATRKKKKSLSACQGEGKKRKSDPG